MPLHSTLAATAVLTSALLLSACGGNSPAAPEAAAASEPTAARPSAAPGGPEFFTKVQSCLKAAGLDDVLPSDLPTGRPSGMPTDLPTDGTMPTPPDGVGPPSGGSDGGEPFAALSDPDVQDALKACGLELPTRP